MPQSDFVAVVLAAGQGTRMKGALPKVLHTVCDRPMVNWSVQAALDAGASRVVVVLGHGRAQVEEELSKHFDAKVSTVLQEEQRGTGHAVKCALPALADTEGAVLILYGDCPLIPAAALSALNTRAEQGDGPLAMLTAALDDPTGYGRIIRNAQGAAIAIREHRDCSEAEHAITEVNPGIYAVRVDFLRSAIAELTADNAQGEIYLTDVVALAAQAGGVTTAPWPMEDLMGINDRWQLAVASRAMQQRINRRHAINGVTIRDPNATWIGAEVRIAPDATIEPHVHLRGACRIGQGARVDTGCVLSNVEVADEALLKPYTVATDSRIGSRTQTGPFAHLRPETDLGEDCRIGNFVETKKTKMGRGSKANHLSYLGNGEIGEQVNVGAGTIFCNYDGYRKHTTVLEDGAFIGSSSQLVAPLTVGKNAYVATGSTVTRDVPEDALAIARGKQLNKEGYGPRLRARLKSGK